MPSIIPIYKEQVDVVMWELSTQTDPVEILDTENEKAVDKCDVAVSPQTWQQMLLKDKE